MNLIIFQCKSDKEEIPLPSHVTEETVNGVTYVHNAKIPFSDIVLEPELILGGENSENYFFSAEPIVEEDRDGNIYVIDWRQYNIKKFSNNGKYIKTIGKKGQGPGEFILGPIDIGFYSNNKMLAADGNNHRFQLFDTEGTFIRLHKPKDHKPWRFVLDSNGNLYENYKGPGIPDPENPEDTYFPMLRKLDTEFNVIGYTGKTIRYKDNFTNAKMNSRILGIDRKDNIYICYLCINRIEIFKNDTLSMVVDRELYFEPKEAEIKEGNFSHKTFDRISSGYKVAADSLCNFYVLTKYSGYNQSRQQDDNEINTVLEIFNPRGWLIHSIPIRKYYPVHMFVGKGNKIYLTDGASFTLYRFKSVID